jgi:hypothetical protein
MSEKCKSTSPSAVRVQLDVMGRLEKGEQIVDICHNVRFANISVDKKNQLDVTFCILYFSSNSCSTSFGQPCAHHQELTTA